ncbi:DUF3638 domain-containing protein [Legionella hackeliae]|uniref:DUF3638 domain-containing protein n=1 Tax=Legionella hackeliae TaxID=449 RepID=A0A0A8UZF9_LEGHA|nr:DUF3638 domain-containing protein [Legionella hackeliae]KTD12691.1 hypothetical protein Lhac_1562 [Legionella hackeliae]CEK12109.1 protein of unknown function [Legionella hackeliae]STX48896.1 Protein of uncharacterised function (DUF3638) [Legionella hackeliae]
MTKITPAIFAGIENDAHLGGLYQLGGQPFIDAIDYLQEYVKELQIKGEVPPAYKKLLDDMDYLKRVEKELEAVRVLDAFYEADIKKLATDIKNKVLALKEGERLFIPGGWININGGGHAMVYQIMRTSDEEFSFTAINAGSGLNYHHKKSSREKELYNPTKAWEFRAPTTDFQKEELGLFLSRLLKAKVPTKKRKFFTEKVLYEETLASISHIGGMATEKNKIPDFGYTGSQLSGTCTQRCLHQMLKLNSPSAIDYERFIFEFKHYALLDYVKACFDTKVLPLTPGAISQIRLAVENNLKILKISHQSDNGIKQPLFDDVTTEDYVNELRTIQQRLDTHKFTATSKRITEDDPEPDLELYSSSSITGKPSLFRSTTDNKFPLPFNFNSGKNLLKNLELAIQNLKELPTPEAQYYYLQQIMASLPLDVEAKRPGYEELKTVIDCQILEAHLDSLQRVLVNLQENWLKTGQVPTLNVMGLQLITMQVRVKEMITRTQKLPSFMPFAATMLNTLLEHNRRNPFYATNHVVFDRNFAQMQKDFSDAKTNTHPVFYKFLNDLMATEPTLYEQLNAQYDSTFGSDTSELHKLIRLKENDLRALYLISLHLSGKTLLKTNGTPDFSPIIQKIKDYLSFEAKLRRAINPFFLKNLDDKPRLDFIINDKDRHLMLYTPLYPTFLTWQELSTKLPENKYVLPESPAKDALDAEITKYCSLNQTRPLKSANEIQLQPIKSKVAVDRPVTQADITARDYLHLRTQPKFQVALTIDYFTRNIDKLALEANKRYLEANLFQSTLLQTEFKKTAFFPQFDRLLKTGYRFFNKNGQLTTDSLLFVRLNFLVSRYLYQMDKSAGILRLKMLQADLLKQLELENDSKVTYVLQQYLFLTTTTLIELDQNPGELFEHAFKAYVYIQSHANPFILEDLAHRVDVDSNIAKFQTLLSQQSEQKLQKAVEDYLQSDPGSREYTVTPAKFPIYRLQNKDGAQLEFNILECKLFERGLARSGVPLALQNHPLMKHLGLQDKQECLVNSDGSYMILPDKENEVSLFYQTDKLTVQKTWRVAGTVDEYELQPLTERHHAYHANRSISPTNSSLPLVLTDGSMDYWRSKNPIKGNLLVCNGKPSYLVKGGEKFVLLNEKGEETNYQLSKLKPEWIRLLNTFESNQFILAHSNPTDTVIKLPRYNLTFNVSDAKPELIHQETQECVVDAPSPIHPAVAGLLLEKKGHTRYLVPVSRFYATEKDAEPGDFYPVIHDTYGTIAKSEVKEEWKRRPPLQKPMWHYQGSERAISFRLHNGEPVADTVADALYLAYTYLATNQPEKAWAVLQDCNARLGGLTGDPAELQFVSWICEDLPHILAHKHDKQKKAIRSTPPYVACQLKAMSLVSDFLLQDRKFDLKNPSQEDTANAQYAQLQYQQTKNFLDRLPSKIYQSFTRLQSMRRHLEHSFTLSTLERKRLLDYYQQSQPDKTFPKGALGYEWMLLSIEAIQQEQDTLIARKQSGLLSKDDTKRLAFIEKQLQKIKPTIANSSSLVPVRIDLTLKSDSKIEESRLKKTTKDIFEKWKMQLSLEKEEDDLKLKAAFDVLTSEINEDTFITHFPTYLKLAASGQDPTLQHRLSTFCAATLIANRHTPLDKQESHIPLLCNILYRACHHHFNTKLTTITLADLITRVSDSYCPSLEVLEARDVYDPILAKPKEILAKDRPKFVPLTVPTLEKTALLEQEDAQVFIESKDSAVKEFHGLIAKYRKVHEETVTKIKDTTNEELAGALLLQAEQQQKEIAQRLIDTPQLAIFIRDLVAHVEKPLAEQREKAWNNALALANEGPEDVKRAREWHIARLAKEKPTLNKQDLFTLYCRGDANYGAELTGLSPEKVKTLYAAIHAALFKDIQGQLFKQVGKKIDSAVSMGNADDAVQALEILAREEIPALTSPATVIIQHEEDILLRRRQVSAIASLLESSPDGKGFKETIEKIIPGGGKSKVIIPVAAESKARGDNLVVWEVPPELLATNYVDANRTSQRLFGKRAYRFEFNRDSNCSPKRLQQMYYLFTEIMTTRSYLMTTGPSIRSLELKYLELLFAKDRDSNWRKQVYWLDKITNLFHHNADCLIDEVHQGLWLKKKLNYTLGNTSPLEPNLIKNGVALYSFIDKDFVKKAHELPLNYDWEPFQNELANKLLNEQASPLSHFVAKAVKLYGNKAKEELLAYLTNKATELSPIVLNAKLEDKATLAFFKQQINVLLPSTLRGNTTVSKFEVTYGPSLIQGLSPVEYTLAIPYVGNKVSNEASRFGNELEAMNYSIQMMLIRGISEELFAERIASWISTARQELFQNPNFKHLDETPTARGFALLEKGLTLNQVDLANPKQMAELHERHKYNRSLINTLLQERVLKQIHQDGAILHSDAYNHVDIYRSTQGVSGTPSNHTTYHQRLNFDPKNSFGSDAYTVELLRSKKTNITYLDYTNVAEFIKTAFTKSESKERIRAIIDINATFTGVTNLDVAREIVNFIKENPTHFSNPIKHVLYFNADQVLCALDVEKPEKPIVLGTSDEKEIAHLLGSSPEERFTLYDQVHTLGIDIRQYSHAHALVLTDEKDSFQAWKQGNDRMRGLSQSQTVEFISPTRILGLSYDELVKRLQANDQKVLELDNLFAAKGQMTNLLRRTCLSLIQDLPSEEVEAKANLAKHFEEFFIDVPSRDFFALYGALSRKDKIENIFKSFKTQLLDIWTECHKKANIRLSSEALDLIGKSLQDIIDRAIPNCQAEYENAHDSGNKEVQVQKQVQKQVQTQRVALNASYNKQRRPANELTWNYTSQVRSFQDNIKNKTVTANSLCDKTATPNLFSENLRLSTNYAVTYRYQDEYTDAFLKPVFLVWYHLDDKKCLHATVVTPQESESLEKLINLNGVNNSWLATTDDTVIAGTAPDNICSNSEYQELREQVRFFNGECKSLLNQDTPLLWLDKKASDKLAFFEQHLLPYRPGSETELEQLKTTLLKGNIEGFVYITKHPFDDLIDCDWQTLFPSAAPVQIAEYQKMASVFNYLNKNWFSKNLTQELSKFNLPPNSLFYANEQVQRLSKIKKLLQQVEQLKTPLLTQLPEEEKLCLEKCLDITLETFYEQQGIKNPSTAPIGSIELATVEAFNILQNHPVMQIPELQSERGDTLFSNWFRKLAQNTSSKEVLRAILKKNPTMSVLHSILVNNSCDEFITQSVLSSMELSEDTLKLLAEKSLSTESIDKLLKKTNLSDDVLETLICNKKVNLSTTQLSFILERTKNSSIVAAAYSHQSANEDIKKAVFTHIAFNSVTLKTLLKSRAIDANTAIGLLSHPTAITSPVLLTMVAEFGSRVVLPVLSHSAITPSTKSKILNITELTLEVAQKLSEDNDHELCQNLTTKIFDKYKIAKESEKIEWENCLDKIFKHYIKRDNEHKENILTVVKAQLTSKTGFSIIPFSERAFNHPRLGFMLLSSFGSQAIPMLPFQEMVNVANTDELKLLLQQEKTGNLSEDQLQLLIKKCTTSELRDLILTRTDLSEKILRQFLEDKELTETQLGLIIKMAREDSTLKLAYAHPAATPANRKLIYTRSAFSSDTLLSLIYEDKLDNEEILFIFDNTKLINFGHLSHIALKKVNSQVLLAAASHSSANTQLWGLIVENDEFSVHVALRILDKINTYDSRPLLAKLAKKVLSFTEDKQQTEGWDPVLAKLLMKYIHADDFSREEIIEIIKSNPSKSPIIGLMTLRVFGKEARDIELPLTKMIRIATSEEQLLLLIPNFKSKTHYDKLLERDDLTEKVVQAVLKTDHSFTEPQLLSILMDAETEETLTSVYKQAKDLKSVRKTLLQHAALSSNLLLSLVKGLSRDEVKLALQHPAVTSAVLEAMLKEKLHSDDLLMVVSHRNANTQVRNLAIQSRSFSPAVAQQVIASSNSIDDDHHLFVNLIQRTIEQSHIRLPENSWENCFIELIKKYSKHASLDTIIQEIISTPHLSPKVVKSIIEHTNFVKNLGVRNNLLDILFKLGNAQEDTLIDLLEKYQEEGKQKDALDVIREQSDLSPRLGLTMVRLFGKDATEAITLPMKAMISIANEDDVKLLVDPDKTGKLSEDDLLSLAEKTTSQNDLDKLLNRQELTEPVLRVIAKKCSKEDQFEKILQKNRLSYELYIIVANKVPGYDNLTKALSNLSESDRRTWLDFRTTQYNEMKQQLPADAKQQIELSLEQLKLKACKHAVKALHSPSYENVARTAITLYCQLNKATKTYFDNPNGDYQNFQKECTELITQAKSVLEQHRGYKQILLDILNVLLNVVTLKFAFSNNWRFFQAKTATADVADIVGETIKNPPPSKPT